MVTTEIIHCKGFDIFIECNVRIVEANDDTIEADFDSTLEENEEVPASPKYVGIAKRSKPRNPAANFCKKAPVSPLSTVTRKSPRHLDKNKKVQSMEQNVDVSTNKTEIKEAPFIGKRSPKHTGKNKNAVVENINYYIERYKANRETAQNREMEQKNNKKRATIQDSANAGVWYTCKKRRNKGNDDWLENSS